MAIAKVSSRGQITIPAAMRRKLGIEPDSRVEVTLVDDEIIVRRLRSIRELEGIFHDRVQGSKPLGWEEERRRAETTVARQVAKE